MTQTQYEPAISDKISRPLSAFRYMEHDPAQVTVQRVAQELQSGDAVDTGLGISANIPRILLERGRHGDVAWLLEQGAIGGVPLLESQLGCASSTEAFLPSSQQFTCFQGGDSGLALMSLLQIGADGSVNVSYLPARPHVTVGCGGFTDITPHAKRVIFSGFFNAGAQLQLEEGRLRIIRRGKAKRLVQDVVHVTFSGKRAIGLGQQVQYITERCVLELTPDGLLVTEIVPGIDPERDVLAQSNTPLRLTDDLKPMNPHYFQQGRHHE